MLEGLGCWTQHVQKLKPARIHPNTVGSPVEGPYPTTDPALAEPITSPTWENPVLAIETLEERPQEKLHGPAIARLPKLSTAKLDLPIHAMNMKGHCRLRIHQQQVSCRRSLKSDLMVGTGLTDLRNPAWKKPSKHHTRQACGPWDRHNYHTGC